jgi:hypothetical protein
VKDPLTRLTEKAATLGNYHRKFRHIIATNIDNLTASLEQKGLLDRVHLWSYSTEIPGEMDTISEVAGTTDQALDFLGCYYALQFLHLNLRMVDIVKLELGASHERALTGRKLMLESGRMFRYLTKNYMEHLLAIFLGRQKVPEFVMLGVGTRADQDDIDLGIVYRPGENPEKLSRALARLSAEMLKKATRLHFHLSEHVGQHSLAATIEDYEEILDKGTHDFVIITEMLGAAPILGSYELFDEFKVKVTNRFFYDPDVAENRFHEGYLRGILGEIRSLLTRPRTADILCPKDDGLRPVKSLLSALKLVSGVDKTNAWYIIDELRAINPQREDQYNDLEAALSFFELFRHLYQIMVAQDEDISLAEADIESALGGIADMIGFRRKGVVSAEDFMLVNYYEHLDMGNDAVSTLTGDLRRHLRKISVFNPIFSGEIHKRPGFKGNLAVDFIRASSFLKGITYWDDFLEELSDRDKPFYREFIESFHSLPERLRKKVAGGYISGTPYDAASVLRFLVIIGERADSAEARSIFDLVSCLFVDELQEVRDISIALSRMVTAHPVAFNSFLAMINRDCLSRIVQLVRARLPLPEMQPFYNQLTALCELHYQSSQFFKRHFHSILNKHPLFIENLYNDEKLREITNGFYSDLSSFASLGERAEQLGDYYDLEFVRVSLLVMSGANPERTDAEFIEFSDNYTLALYEIGQEEVHLSLGYSRHTHDLFALYAVGGHAREQGFDDDYDMIAILDSSDAEQVDFCNKIMGRMNSEILKRGILPHHRFADHFGSYIVSFAQLAGHLASDSDEIFIDQSQILSSRMLVGSRKLEDKLCNEVIRPLIFEKGAAYLQRMKGELESRHQDMNDDHLADIKECPGGLRDIEMLLLMYMVKYKIRDPLSRKFLHRLAELEPENGEQFHLIGRHLDFIKGLRDNYRLKIAAHNYIEREYLQAVAEGLGYGDGDGAAGKLFDDYLERTDKTAEIINALVDKIRI